MWKAVNEDASVNGTDKGVSGGEAEVANTKTAEATDTAAEMAETATEMAETAAKAAVTTTHRRCRFGVRKIDAWKPGRAGLHCSKRQDGER